MIKAIGVRVNDSKQNSKSIDIIGEKSVVSGLGVLNTCTKLIPYEILSENTRITLSLLEEVRPKVYVVYWLKGSRDELGLSSTDYVEVGNINTADRNALAESYVKIWSPSLKDAHWEKKYGIITIITITIIIITIIITTIEHII